MVKGKKPTESQLEKKVTDLENKWKRALADYLNLEKRSKKERATFIRLANAALLDKLLSVFDSLEKCEQHLQDKGLTFSLKQFKTILESEGVEEIEVEGKEFDPETMDAVEMVTGSKNKVIEVVLKGYQLSDRVLRPAKVKVGGQKGD